MKEEVFAGVQSVLFAGDESRPTVSISYVRRVHTSAAPELDVGTFRQSTSILLSEDLHGFHFDTNGILAEQLQGAVHSPLSRRWDLQAFESGLGYHASRLPEGLPSHVLHPTHLTTSSPPRP